MTDTELPPDLRGLRLLAEADCPHCEKGQVVSDDWVSFEEWRRRRPVLTPEDEDDLVEQYFLVVCDFDAVPPMRTPCEHCDGHGRQSTQLELRELLGLVLEHVDQPIISPGELDELVDHVKQTITRAALSSQGLMDGRDTSEWLRAVQEGAEALRSIGELRARQKG